MGIDLLVLASRLERSFGVRIGPDQLRKMITRNDPPDIRVGELFDFVRSEVPQSGVLDHELDGDALWPIYQRAISDVLDVELGVITKKGSMTSERRGFCNA